MHDEEHTRTVDPTLYILSNMRPESRVEFFEELMKCYCPNCGKERKSSGEPCQCQNDE